MVLLQNQRLFLEDSETTDVYTNVLSLLQTKCDEACEKTPRARNEEDARLVQPRSDPTDGQDGTQPDWLPREVELPQYHAPQGQTTAMAKHEAIIIRHHPPSEQEPKLRI